jgi:hypothetical protein
MINVELYPSNFNYLGIKYNIIQITKDNYNQHIFLIKRVIQNFNDEIQWDGMFDLKESIERFLKGMVMYIGIMNNQPFGYLWFEEIENKFKIFNVFVRNNVEIKNYNGQEFVSDIIDRFYKDKFIFAEIDEWNTKSIKMFLKLGFVII